jgi:hypothetical protein
MKREILAIDVGENLVGVYSVTDQKYRAYYGNERLAGIKRICRALEVITYNGKTYDLPIISKLSNLLGQEFTLTGTHFDMRSVCWSDRIYGSNLRDTYFIHYDSLPNFEDTHTGSNECDTYMTWKLWERMKSGTLKVLDGHRS